MKCEDHTKTVAMTTICELSLLHEQKRKAQ